MTRPDVMRQARLTLRDSSPPEPPTETVGDFVKAFLTLVLLCAAFYSASFVVASFGFIRP